MVRTRYPLPDSNVGALDREWGDGIVRGSRAMQLFYTGGLSSVFDPKRFARYVERLARFLMFVDDRRALGAQLEHLSTRDLEAEYEACESASLFLAGRAAQLRELCAARGVGSREG